MEDNVLRFPMDKAVAKKEFDTEEEAIAFGQTLDRPFVWGKEKDSGKYKIFLFPEGTKITLTPIKEKLAEIIPINSGDKNAS